MSQEKTLNNLINRVILNEGFIDTFKSLFSKSQSNYIHNIVEYKENIINAILEYYYTHNNEQSFTNRIHELESSLYNVLTYNNLEIDKFEDLYNRKLKQSFNNKEIDDLRDEYSKFRRNIISICEKKGLLANVSNLKWFVINSNGHLSNIRKNYMTLDNLSYDKLNDNLKKIILFIEKYPFKDGLRFKIPFLFDDFIKHLDNMIVYHSNASYIEPTEKLLQSLKFNQVRNRSEFMRSDIGKDSSEGSDTQIVISSFVKFLIENYSNIFNFVKLDKQSSQYKLFSEVLLKILMNLSVNASHR